MLKKRIHIIDEIRGFCVMCMVFHHCMFTLGFMYNQPIAKEMFLFFSKISAGFAFAFIMMCGISCTFSSSNLKRGLKIAAAAIVITIATYIVIPDSPIDFGILHLLGSCVLLYAVCSKVIKKIPPLAGIILSLLFLVLTWHTSSGFWGIEGLLTLEFPRSLYVDNSLMFLGFISPYKSYSDFFPLLPWMFAFFLGVFTGFAAKGHYPQFMYKPRVKFFSVLGTNAFLIYVIHQPIIYGVSYLLTLIPGGI